MVFADDVLDALPEECVSVAVERVSHATPLPEFEHPESVAYVFGPENGSLDESILACCTHVVSIPGHECSNLAAAVNVVLYDRIAKRWVQVREQCEAAEGIMKRFGTEAAFDDIVGEKLVSFAQAAAERPEFAQALPGFISRLREMFTLEELCGNLDRIERLWPEMEEAGRMGDPLCIEEPETVSERSRQLDALKDLLTAPALGTS